MRGKHLGHQNKHGEDEEREIGKRDILTAFALDNAAGLDKRGYKKDGIGYPGGERKQLTHSFILAVLV